MWTLRKKNIKRLEDFEMWIRQWLEIISWKICPRTVRDKDCSCQGLLVTRTVLHKDCSWQGLFVTRTVYPTEIKLPTNNDENIYWWNKQALILCQRITNNVIGFLTLLIEAIRLAIVIGQEDCSRYMYVEQRPERPDRSFLSWFQERLNHTILMTRPAAVIW